MSITDPSRLEVAATLLGSRLYRIFIYKPFVERIGLRGSERVLDFGAGWGDVAFYAAPKLAQGGSMTLLDISTTWQQVAKKRLRRFSNLSFVNADVFSAGVEDGSYDVIVVHFMLHDIPPPQRRAIITELAKKLRHNGFVYISEPTVKSHGIPSDEILDLMQTAGLHMESKRVSRRFFEGKFTRP